MIVADLDSPFGYSSGPSIFRRGRQTIETFVAQPDATPLPIDLGCSAVFYPPTGAVVLYQPLEELISKSLSHTKEMAMLPVSEEDEQTVEALIKRRVGVLKVRPLVR